MRPAPLLGSVLLPLAAAQSLFSSVDTCPGDVTLVGYGVVSLVNAAWNVPGEPAGDVAVADGAVMPTMNGRTYFANTCSLGGVKSASDYLSLDLLGKALRYTTDVSGAGCGCNAAFYLTSMSHNAKQTDCQDWYCDANAVCGHSCVEIDIQEANNRAWHSTLHSKDDKNGLMKGYGGGAEGLQGWSGPRDFSSDEYGPGASCIDTQKPFQVTTSFPVDETGALQDVKTVLSQKGHDCTLSVKLAGYSGEAELSAALATGLTPVISYWDSDDMLWMDGIGKDQAGPCAADKAGDCAYSVKFYDFSVANIGAAQPKAPPTFAEQQKANAEAYAASLTTGAPAPAPAPATTTAAAAAASKPTFSDASLVSGKYKFSGFATADEARNLCGEGTRLAMPKSKEDYDAMLAALSDAMGQGFLGQHFPSNTIWLGGMWSPSQQSFAWDDGTAIPDDWFHWGEGQPSESGSDHGKEPWLCMLLDGKVHDSEPHFQFGVMCEEGEAPKAGGVESSPSVAASEEGPGYCCLLSTSEKAEEKCGTCLYTSEPGNWCAASRDSCGKCGERTTWCFGEQPTTTTGVPAPTAAPANAPVQYSYNGFTNAPDCDCGWLRHDDCTDTTTSCATSCRKINNRPCQAPGTTTAQPWTTEEPDETTTAEAETAPAEVLGGTAAPAGTRGRYVFRGFADATGAKALCEGHGHLPMPKTVEAHKVLGLALAAAIGDGKMSGGRTDPANSTIWLGGRWSVLHTQWEWDDGKFAEVVRWGEGQPDGPQWNRQQEPLMAMTYDKTEGGLVEDKGWDTSYFGVICEEESEERHDEPGDADGDSGLGYCCMSAEDHVDSCGTCVIWAHPSHNGFCSLSRSECGHCGTAATWCTNLTEAFVRKFVLPPRTLRVQVADGRPLPSLSLGLVLVAGALIGVARTRWNRWRVRREGASELGVLEDTPRAVLGSPRRSYEPCEGRGGL